MIPKTSTSFNFYIKKTNNSEINTRGEIWRLYFTLFFIGENISLPFKCHSCINCDRSNPEECVGVRKKNTKLLGDGNVFPNSRYIFQLYYNQDFFFIVTSKDIL